jgi:hypothetical protein
MRTLRLTSIVVAAALSWACSDGSSTPVAAPDPAAYPTAKDRYEGASGDDTWQTASRLPVGSRQFRTLFPNFDVDYVKFDLVADGTVYELSANHLSVPADLFAFVFDVDGVTTLGPAAFIEYDEDDFIAYDPHFVFTVHQSGTYFAKITSYAARDAATRRAAQASYTLSIHEFVDADADGWSAYYDCDDADTTVFPFANDVPGDGVDQNCEGIDALDPTAEDGAEPDDTPATAKPLPLAPANPYEITFQRSVARVGARTVGPGGEDWFRFTIPAHGAVELSTLSDDLPSLNVSVFDAETATTVYEGLPWWTRIENTADAPTAYHARFTALSPAFYIPSHYSLGIDRDGDGSYDRDWDEARDCDDADAAVYPFAPEIASDGVDSDCDGYDDT